VIDQVESRHQLRRTYAEFRIPVPLPQGAPGKVLLAFAPSEQQVADLKQVLPQTITDPEELAAQLAETCLLGATVAERDRCTMRASSPVPVPVGVSGPRPVSKQDR
jgi:IclR family transcriptional regulator, acetate operon repressor